MNWKDLDIFPVMGVALTAENTMKLDFSAENKELLTVDLGNTASFDRYVFDQIKSNRKKYGIGGYLENRAIYVRSEVFGTDESGSRTIHLGIDIWTEAGAPVYAPLAGKVHSFQDNAGFGNYGATIILEHEMEGNPLFSLYGHLFLSDLDGLEIGQEVKAGDLLCHVGPFPENGDWPPHLHFQLMLDLNGNFGDYPGVAAKKDLGFYRANCLDPNLVLRCEVL